MIIKGVSDGWQTIGNFYNVSTVFEFFESIQAPEYGSVQCKSQYIYVGIGIEYEIVYEKE